MQFSTCFRFSNYKKWVTEISTTAQGMVPFPIPSWSREVLPKRHTWKCGWGWGGLSPCVAWVYVYWTAQKQVVWEWMHFTFLEDWRKRDPEVGINREAKTRGQKLLTFLPERSPDIRKPRHPSHPCFSPAFPMKAEPASWGAEAYLTPFLEGSQLSPQALTVTQRGKLSPLDTINFCSNTGHLGT